jgi:hypothetical protein
MILLSLVAVFNGENYADGDPRAMNWELLRLQLSPPQFVYRVSDETGLLKS